MAVPSEFFHHASDREDRGRGRPEGSLVAGHLPVQQGGHAGQAGQSSQHPNLPQLPFAHHHPMQQGYNASMHPLVDRADCNRHGARASQVDFNPGGEREREREKQRPSRSQTEKMLEFAAKFLGLGFRTD